MKLIVQIPSFNEENTIAQTLRDIPRRIDGVSEIETLVIDDGSTDGTAEAARKAGATHVLRLSHRGLASAFVAGLDAALRLNADIIVNTDADNQYQGSDIAKLIAPIVKGTADVVIGDRNVSSSPHMGFLKRLLQRLGSWTVSRASGISVPDVTSGFRAFSRDAASQLNVFNPFTYTLETVIQAGNRNLSVQSVAVGTNGPTRPSRLYRGLGTYMRKSATTIFRIYTLYKPLKTFFAIGALLLAAGAAVGGRFLYFYYFVEGQRAGHIQSVILAAILLIAGFQTLLVGLLADLISVNRRLSEDVLLRLKRLEPPATAVAPRRSQPQPARQEPRDKPAEKVAARPAPPPQTSQAPRPRREATSAAQPKPAAPQKPSTQWVWLLDEDKLENRNSAQAARHEAKAESKAESKPELKDDSKPEPKSDAPVPRERPVHDRKPVIHVDDLDEESDEPGDQEEVAVASSGSEGRPSGSRRRRRRRGGMRHNADLPGNRGKHLITDAPSSDKE